MSPSSTLRAWLNADFIAAAFDETERAFLRESLLPNGDNPYYPVETAETRDTVFLLSVGELERYFPTEEDRIAYATDYAKTQGVVYYDQRCWYWTRSNGTRAANVSYINTGGVFVHKHLSTYKYAVRHAIRCAVPEG